MCRGLILTCFLSKLFPLKYYCNEFCWYSCLGGRLLFNQSRTGVDIVGTRIQPRVGEPAAAPIAVASVPVPVSVAPGVARAHTPISTAAIAPEEVLA